MKVSILLGAVALVCVTGFSAMAQPAPGSVSVIQANRLQTMQTIRQDAQAQVQSILGGVVGKPTPAQRAAIMAVRQAARAHITAANMDARAQMQALRAQLKAARAGMKP